MKIQKMTVEDLQRVAELVGQLGYPSTVEKMRARFKVVSASDECALFVAREGREVIGWAQVSRETETMLSEARAELDALVVCETVRGKGVGTELVRAAESWAREKGLGLMRVRSNVIREDAHKFYERVGYTLKKKWCLFVKELPVRADELREGEDFYCEGPAMVFTEKYLRERAYCCGSGCRHCPY